MDIRIITHHIKLMRSNSEQIARNKYCGGLEGLACARKNRTRKKILGVKKDKKKLYERVRVRRIDDEDLGVQHAYVECEQAKEKIKKTL